MKKKQILPLIIGAAFLAACSGTSLGQSSTEDASSSSSGSSEGSSYVSSIPTGDSTTISSSSVDSYTDGDYSYSEISDYSSLLTNDITSLGSNTTLPETYTSLASEANTISEAGNYYLSGEIGAITLKLKTAGEVHLYLDNATLTNSAGKAISAKSSDLTTKLTITTLSASSISATKNAIDVLSDVVFNGSGLLSITSTGKSAIKTEKTAYVVNASLLLKAEGDEDGHGISAETIYGVSSTINVPDAGKDGLHAEIADAGLTTYVNSAGFVYLKDVIFTYVGTGDGIQADSFAYLNGGSFDISTTARFVAYGSTEATSEGITDSDDFKYKLSGSTYSKVDSEQRGRSGTYAMVNSVKGIKVGTIDQDEEDSSGNTTTTDISSKLYALEIDGSTLNLATDDDGLHVNEGTLVLTDANVTASSLDQPLCSDGPLTINDSTINITASYEGIQGSSIHINGENTKIDIVSSDDGMNASSDFADTDTSFYALRLNINGGEVNVNAGGDGLDSNGSITFSGGITRVEGSSNGGDSPLDSAESNENRNDHGIYTNGGILIATGSNGMLESPQSSSSQYSVVYSGNSSISANSTVKVLDSSSNTLISQTTTKASQAMILSCPSFTKGGTYSISVNNASLTSFTISQIVTTIGNSSQGGGAGGPGGGRH